VTGVQTCALPIWMCAIVLEILKLIAEGRGDASIANRER
jgi:hypothetical protein